MMSDFNDKSDTFEFDPIKDNKPRVNRGGSDPYSNARQNTVREDDGDSPNYTLVYVALILAILLIVVVIAGILIMGREPEKTPPPQQQEEILPENQGEEEPNEEEDVDITLLCTVTFYSDSVAKQGEKYTVHADLYDGELYKFGSRKLTISDETDIREKGGKRVSKEAFVSLIENMAGESLAFSAEIREKDNLVLSVSFDGSIAEENPPEEEEPPTEEEPPIEENPSDEDGEIILPGEEPQIPDGI